MRYQTPSLHPNSAHVTAQGTDTEAAHSCKELTPDKSTQSGQLFEQNQLAEGYVRKDSENVADTIRLIFRLDLLNKLIFSPALSKPEFSCFFVDMC